MNYSIVPVQPIGSQTQIYQELDPDILRDQVSRFAGFLLTQKGRKKSTIHLYCTMIIRILREENSLILTKFIIENRITDMHMKEYAANYIRNTTVAMELYTEFMGDKLKFGRPPKDKPVVKDTLTEGEVSLLMDACKNNREKAMVAVLAYSGARNEEVCNLKVNDIDYGNNTIRIIEGKGTKSRVVCISGDCVKVLLEYIGDYPRENTDCLFTSVRGNVKYTTYALRKTIKRIAARTNIKKRVYPHLFRHSLACNMLFRGANLLTIKEQLGHSFIETTMIYIRSRADRVAAEYRMFTPSYV